MKRMTIDELLAAVPDLTSSHPERAWMDEAKVEAIGRFLAPFPETIDGCASASAQPETSMAASFYPRSHDENGHSNGTDLQKWIHGTE